jgi:hypothetical protein
LGPKQLRPIGIGQGRQRRVGSEITSAFASTPRQLEAASRARVELDIQRAAAAACELSEAKARTLAALGNSGISEEEWNLSTLIPKRHQPQRRYPTTPVSSRFRFAELPCGGRRQEGANGCPPKKSIALESIALESSLRRRKTRADRDGGDEKKNPNKDRSR